MADRGDPGILAHLRAVRDSFMPSVSEYPLNRNRPMHAIGSARDANRQLVGLLSAGPVLRGPRCWPRAQGVCDECCGNQCLDQADGFGARAVCQRWAMLPGITAADTGPARGPYEDTPCSALEVGKTTARGTSVLTIVSRERRSQGYTHGCSLLHNACAWTSGVPNFPRSSCGGGRATSSDGACVRRTRSAGHRTRSCSDRLHVARS
jgi:hypothetical protein